MGLIQRLGARTTYLDVNVFIYALEGHAAFSEALGSLFEEVQNGRIATVTSEITLAEALVKPFREGRTDLATVYERFLQTRPSFAVLPVTRSILVEAARLRATTRLKLPDAIHAATAQLAGCSVLLTNDTGIAAVPGVEVLRLSEVAGHG